MMSYFTSTRPWIGRWLVGVAVLHTVFAAVVFHAPLWDMAQRGVFDTLGQNPTAAATAWFVLFGLLMGLLGLATTPLERHAGFGGRRIGFMCPGAGLNARLRILARLASRHCVNFRTPDRAILMSRSNQTL
jgi:hypothetical protein